MKIDRIELAQRVGKKARGFLIKLFKPENGAVEVRSCEVTGAKWQNCTSFSEARAIEDVFAPQLVGSLRHLLSKVTPTAGVFIMPKRAIETKGLVLGSIHIVSSYAADGSALIVMHFKHLIGDVYNAFSSNLSRAAQAADAREELALGMLADLSLPLLDLCSFSEIEEVQGESKKHPLFQTLALRADEIRFQVELIKRYIDGMERVPVTVVSR